MPSQALPRAAGERLALGATYLLAVTAFAVPVGVATATLGLWLGMLLAPPPRARLLQPVPLMTLLFLGYALIRFALRQAAPDAPATWAATWDWLQLSAFLPCALVLAGAPRRAERLLLLALSGLVLGMLWRVDWHLLSGQMSVYLQNRPGFGFTALAFGLYSATALLGLTLWQRRLTQAVAPRWRWLAVLGLILVVALLAQGLFMTQSRGTWLACIVVLALALGWRWHTERAILWREGLILGAVAAVLLFHAGSVGQRLAQEADTAIALATATPEQVDPQSSLAVRWAAQRFALTAWRERPWLGWGPGSTPRLIEQAPERDALVTAGQRLRHLHNTYLEILVQLGAIGLLLTLALGAALLHGLWQAHRHRRQVPELTVFATLGLLLLALWCAFDFRALHQDWRAYWTLLAGVAASLVWRAPPAPLAHAAERVQRD